MRIATILACALCLACFGGCGVRSEAARAEAAPAASLFAVDSDVQWRLPHRLDEISGLALTPDGRLFGHEDEKGILYQIDIASGGVEKSFSLGDPLVHDDFEDIAITDSSDFYLIASAGRLYRFREGEDGAHVAYETFDTGLQDTCEIEGLAFLRAQQSLILVCKSIYAPNMRGTLALFAWSLRDHRVRPWLNVPAAPIAAAIGAHHVHPSAIAFDGQSGRIVLLAGREHAMIELDSHGAVRAARQLGAQHRQAEGAAILPDGSLVISDEGATDRALLTRYPRAHE